MKIQIEIEIPDEFDPERAKEIMNEFIDVGELQEYVIENLRVEAAQ